MRKSSHFSINPAFDLKIKSCRGGHFYPAEIEHFYPASDSLNTFRIIATVSEKLMGKQVREQIGCYVPIYSL
jgi:hypothetical protein